MLLCKAAIRHSHSLVSVYVGHYWADSPHSPGEPPCFEILPPRGL